MSLFGWDARVYVIFEVRNQCRNQGQGRVVILPSIQEYYVCGVPIIYDYPIAIMRVVGQ